MQKRGTQQPPDRPKRPKLAELVNLPSTDGEKHVHELATNIRKFRAALVDVRRADEARDLESRLALEQREFDIAMGDYIAGCKFNRDLDAFILKHWNVVPTNEDREELKNVLIVAHTGRMREQSDKAGRLLLRVGEQLIETTRSEAAAKAKRARAERHFLEAEFWQRVSPREGRPARHSAYYPTERLRALDQRLTRGKNFGPRSGRGQRFTRIVHEFFQIFLPEFENGHRVFPPPSGA